MKNINVIDLFAGAGGLSEGIMQAGNMNILAHVEWEMPMVKVLRRRLEQAWGDTRKEAEEKVIHFDVQKTDELLYGLPSDSAYCNSNSNIFNQKGIHGLLGSNDVDVIVGGPPCQAYSLVGRAQDKDSMKKDYRNYLFMSFAKIVDNLKPKVFVFENVPGILSAKPHGINVTEEIYRAFSDINYEILSPDRLKGAVFDTVCFGVPQTRRRVVIFGVRKDSGIKLEDLYTTLRSYENYDKVLTLRDAIGNFPKIYPLNNIERIHGKNKSHQDVKSEMSFHCARYVSESNQKIFYEWVTDKLNDLSTEQKLDYYYSKTGHKSHHPKYRSLDWDKPSPTLVAHLYKDGYMFIHPDASQKRSITVREAATLMSFPYDYEFPVSETSAFKMIGNAVPVSFAKYIGLTLKKVLSQ